MENEVLTGELVPSNQKELNMSVVERLVRDPNVDVDKLQKVMDMQDHQLDRDAEKSFNADMVLCQGKIKTVYQNRDNEQTRSRYSDLQTILRAIKPVYTDNGFALSFYEGETNKDGHVRVMVDIMHRDGHTKTRFKDFPIDDVGIKGSVNKTKIHGNQSAFMYGRRVLTCMIFNVPTGDDDDGNAAGRKNEPTITEKQAHTITDLLIAVYGDDHSEFFNYIGCSCAEDIPAKDFNKHKAALSDMVKK